MPRVPIKNNRNLITSSQSVQQLQRRPVNKGVSVSEVIKRKVSEGILYISNLPKVYFAQQLSNVTSGMPYCEVENDEKLLRCLI